MMKHLSLLLAGGLVLASSAAVAQDQPPTPPTPPTPPEARAWGGVVRGGSYLGVMLADVGDGDAAGLNRGETSGARITQVTPGSPADKAGLRANDVVVSVDGTRIESSRDLSRLVRRTPVGTTLQLEVLRDGQRVAVPTTVEERTLELPTSFGFDLDSLNGHFAILRNRMDSLRIAIGDDARRFERELRLEHPGSMGGVHLLAPGRGRIGAELQPLTAQLAKYFGVQGRKGVLVGSVADSGAAHSAGLQAGDVIVAIDGQEVASPGDVSRMISGKDSGSVEMRIVRDRREQTVSVDVPRTRSAFGAGVSFDGGDIRISRNGREMRILGDSAGVHMFDGDRELRIFGDGTEVHIFRDGSGSADTVRLFDEQMLRELKELENLPNMPELRELERLPEMIREEIRIRREAEESEVEAPEPPQPPATDEFGNLPK